MIINGKLLTLVPFKQNETATKSPPTASTVVKYQQILPKGLTLVRDDDLLDEATCQLCGVKLPRSILDMHVKMRHQNENKNNNGALDEIEIIDDDDDDSPKPKAKKPMPALKELSPLEENDNINHEDVVTVDVDPLSILP